MNTKPFALLLALATASLAPTAQAGGNLDCQLGYNL